MNRTDKLNPTALTDVANAWIPVLNKNIEHLSEIRSALDCFSYTDGTCNTFDVLWPILEDYQLVITSDITASEFDIRDCNTLISSVGTEYLDGSVIIPSKIAAEIDINYNSGMLDFNRNYRDNLAWYEMAMYPIVSAAIVYYECRLASAQNEYVKWSKKEMAFDNIELSTKNLFADGQEFRALAQEGFTALGNAITSSGITYDYPTEWKSKLYDYEEGVIDSYYNQFVHDNNGQIEYDWDAITEFLKADPSTITREEYLAMARIMDEMSDKDLQTLLSKSHWHVKTNIFGTEIYAGSKTLTVAAQYYLMIEQTQAEMTIFNPDIKDSLTNQQRAEITNNLTRAYMLNVALNIDGPPTSISFTATEEYDGICHYTIHVNTRYVDNINMWYSPIIDATTANDVTIYPVADDEELTEYAINSTIGMLSDFTEWDEFAAKTIVGFAIDKVIGLDTACGLVVDFGHMGENAVANMQEYVELNGAIEFNDAVSIIKHLGMSASIANVEGFLKCNTILNGVRFEPDELVIRLHVYQQATGITLTEQDIRNALREGNLDVLDSYNKWYTFGGEDLVEDYRSDLHEAYSLYKQEHPEISNFNDMTRQETNAVIEYYENQ